MSTGLTRNQIRGRLAALFAGLEGIQAAYGFGSFFRSGTYADIDIVVVFGPTCLEPLPVFNVLLTLTDKLSETIGVRIDITPLTDREFNQKPLLESDSLIPIYQLRCAEA